MTSQANSSLLAVSIFKILKNNLFDLGNRWSILLPLSPAGVRKPHVRDFFTDVGHAGHNAAPLVTAPLVTMAEI